MLGRPLGRRIIGPLIILFAFGIKPLKENLHKWLMDSLNRFWVHLSTSHLFCG